MVNKYVCVDVYTIQSGDTLYSVSQRYDVDVALLMRVNRIRNPYNLKIGTRLCIPGIPKEEIAPDPLPQVLPEEEEAENRPDPPAECRSMHTIKDGDTLYMIAKMHRVTLDALMKANPEIDPYNMQIGSQLCIPG